jgi:hypothetical protein
MPTAAQWKVQVNTRRKKHAKAFGSGPWAGGTWREKFMTEAPTKGAPLCMGSRDGRMHTPGPGRYSVGNPNNSSVRYDCMKHARVQTCFDVQKTRWEADTTYPVAQYGGVVVNPCRGFSMGSGFGPGQTFVAAAEKTGGLTHGCTYKNQAPDLFMGAPSASSRGPGADKIARARGGGLSGVRFGDPPVPKSDDADAHVDPGPGHYLRDVTHSNIGNKKLFHNPLSWLSSYSNPRASGIGTAARPDLHAASCAPGPAAYDPSEHEGAANSHKGKFLMDPLQDKFEDLRAFRLRMQRLGLHTAGPGEYDVDASALDALSTHPRSSLCSASLRPLLHADSDPAPDDTAPGPQSYDVFGVTHMGIVQAPSAKFGDNINMLSYVMLSFE